MTSQGEDRHSAETPVSRVGQALLRLHRNAENADRPEGQTDALLSAWRAKWSGRREQISSRLEVIEAHLERLSLKAEQSPRLAVVTDPNETETNLPSHS